MSNLYNRRATSGTGENILSARGRKWHGAAESCISTVSYRKMPRHRHVYYFLTNSASHVKWVSTYVYDRSRYLISHAKVSLNRQLNKHFVWPSQCYATFSTKCYVFFTITVHNFKLQKKCFFPLKTKIVPTRNTKAYRGGKVRPHPFWTIGGDERSALRTGRLTPRKECPVPDEQDSLAGCFLEDIYILNATDRRTGQPVTSLHRLLYEFLDFHGAKHMEITTRNLERS